MKIKEIEEKFKNYLIEGFTFKIDYDDAEEDDNFNDISGSYNKDIMIHVGENTLFHYLRSYFELSCGQRMFTVIPSDANITYNILSKVREQYKETFLSELYKDLFKYIKIEQKCCFILASNNNESKIMNKVLDKLSIKKTNWTLNPNSGNKIKMWVL